MLHPVTYKEWVNAAWPCSFFKVEWAEGENLRFISEDGSGTLAILAEHNRYSYRFVKHIVVLNPGSIEDRARDVAKGWIRTTEGFTFTEQNGVAELAVELTINPEWKKCLVTDGQKHWQN